MTTNKAIYIYVLDECSRKAIFSYHSKVFHELSSDPLLRCKFDSLGFGTSILRKALCDSYQSM